MTEFDYVYDFGDNWEHRVIVEQTGKSPAQLKQWEKVKRRAINSFIAVVEDKAMTDITRDDGRAFHKHWLSKVAPKGGGPRKSASMGNRMIGNMRVLYDAYFTPCGQKIRTVDEPVVRSASASLPGA
jgi:Plasmid pRiA4b ORF-3-like protein